MTEKEAINIIEVAIAEVEWECPMDYAVAFDKAIEALEKQTPKKPQITIHNGFCANCGNA